MPVSRYALWLLLPPDAHARFQALIARFSERLGTLLFEPHITLLGGLTGNEEELRRRTRVLAGALAPFEVRLLEAAWLDEFFRCLFVEIALSRALREAHEAAKDAFDQRVEATFYPHLSLVYGDLAERKKENIVDEIGRYFDETVRIEELALYETGGPEWRCIERCRLGSAGIR